MNSKKNQATPAEMPSASADETAKDTEIKPFAFPFSPEFFTPAKANDQPWHQKGNKSNHDQRPGPAPRGSRRSMGKR